MDIISKTHIISSLQMADQELKAYCNTIDSSNFFFQPVDKWSIAQNITHLFASTRITLLVFRLPKFIIRLYGGKPNRPSHSYDELVAKYTLKLQQGGRASGVFIPKPMPASIGQQKIITAFSSKMQQLINVIEKKWHDNELDNYIIPHPLLGKITLRELCYFTVYHTYHHLRIIKERFQ
jgi:DinB superfamily